MLKTKRQKNKTVRQKKITLTQKKKKKKNGTNFELKIYFLIEKY